MTASRQTDVNATVNVEFCDGAIKGFSATLNSEGLKWVSNTHNSSNVHTCMLFTYELHMCIYICIGVWET